MKKIILSIVALIAILWIAMFVTDAKVLVWEVGWTHSDCVEKQKGQIEEGKRNAIAYGIDARSKSDSEKFVLKCLPRSQFKASWRCTYFNGRRFIEKSYSHGDSCPNLL